MIRILCIGRDAPARAATLGAHLGAEFALDAAAMPAAGLRQFEATPPDAVIILDAAAQRAATLARALRERPLGQLIPLLIVAPTPADADRPLADRWLDAHTSDAALGPAVLQALDLPETPAPSLPPPGAPAAPHAPAAAQPPAYFIQELDPSDASGLFDAFAHPATPPADLRLHDSGFSRPRQLSHASIFPSAGSRLHDLNAVQGAIDAAAIKQKLQAVRHRDYYEILGIGRGAEGALVREAFHRLYHQFDPDQLTFSLAQQYDAQLAEIRDALEDAWAVLGDPVLRDAYLEHLLRTP